MAPETPPARRFRPDAALARGGERVRAAEAFRSALRIDPQLAAARRWLAWLAQEAPAAPPPATEIA